ncbi:MAG: NADH-ubiquinone oxidoreductase-F iron-sulfur binding region domain-containing protein [Acidimicrobiales bacterium]
MPPTSTMPTSTMPTSTMPTSTMPSAGGDAGAPRATHTPADAVGTGLLAGYRAGHGPDLAGHLAYHGPPPLPRAGDRGWPARLGAALDASGLTGRGGAGFSSSAKLRLAAGSGGGATLVVNAMEGEPASAKDHVLLSCVPHLVLDGAELAASAVGARRVVVCVADDRHDTARAVARAVAERTGTPLSPVLVELARPPAGYVSGEESALVSWLDGGPGAPTFRPVKGVALSIGRRRALVHNAETLAHVALIARHGPDWFRAVGPSDTPGTALVTVGGAVARPGVFEVAMGSPLGAIIDGAVPTEPVAAVLTGGYGGSWVPAPALSTPYAPRPMGAVGGVVGAGVLVVLPHHACGLAETARLAHYMAGESAGQCGPCVFGLPAVAGNLVELANGVGGAAALRRLEGQLVAIEGRGACRHPDGVVRMVRSALRTFAPDVAAHAAGRPCAHRARPSLLTPARPR